MSADIYFEDPPPPMRRPSRRWQLVADTLRGRPKEWAVVAVYGTAKSGHVTAAEIRAGRRLAFPRGEFEAVSRTVDGESRVYARYVGAS